MIKDMTAITPEYFKYRLEQESEQYKQEIERLNKQLQLISDEFLKYDWENSSKEQIINQLKSLYNSIFKGSDEEKAQDVFYENDYCEENCNDDYKNVG